MRKRTILSVLSLLLVLVMALTACNGGSEATTAPVPDVTEAPVAETDEPEAETDETEAEAEQPGSDTRIAVICSAAGQNDSGYNKAIVEKVNALAAEKGFHAQIVEPTSGVPNAIETMAEDGYNLIFSMEYDFEALVNGVGGAKPLAEQYPDTTFVVFNDNPNLTEDGEVKHANVISVLFNINEPSYLAGYLYGHMNEEMDTLFGDTYKFVSTDTARAAGFIGGTNSAGIVVTSYAFIQGLNDAAEELDVEYEFYQKLDAGFSDSAEGSTVAGTFYDQNANIVFAVAGTVGDGVTSKAKEVGRLAIQVDADLDDQQPGHVLTSVLKLTDVPGETIVNAYLDGTIDELDRLQTFGVASGATDITDMSVISEFIEDEAAWTALREKTDAKKQAIIDGTLEIIDAQAGDTFEAADYPNVNVN
ncbi:MAG TPA: BMP family ABC transporter substrate-binding protein [Clostridiaceae bacterium]|nr:BMP family ABC transporter substrate-binding protein [Clostridiaceae bacterium]